MFEIRPTKNEIKIKGFNSVYYFEFGKTFTHPTEKHDFWEMLYVDSGKIVAVTNGVGTKLSQGQAIFHEPNELHAHISDPTKSGNVLVVSFTTDSKAMNFFSKKIFELDKTAKTLLSLFMTEFKNSFGAIPSDYDTKELPDFKTRNFGASQLLNCYLTEFLIHLIRSEGGAVTPVTEETRAMGRSSVTDLIISYMNEHIYDDLSLSKICEHFAMSCSSLCHLFKNETGKSVIQYYDKLKMTEAKRLLKEDELSVTEISERLNFSCIHAFSRAFKTVFGVSPTEYKKTLVL